MEKKKKTPGIWGVTANKTYIPSVVKSFSWHLEGIDSGFKFKFQCRQTCEKHNKIL